MASFDDRSVGVYKTEIMELDHMIPLNSVVKCMTAIDNNTFVCGTDENKLSLVDKRMSIISLTIPTT